MKDFLRRALGLVMAETLLFAPFLWGEGADGEASTRQVHGAPVSGQVERERESEDSASEREIAPGDNLVEESGGKAEVAREEDEEDSLLVSALVDENGGVLEEGGLRLHIPPGALLEPIEISIYGLTGTHEVPEGRQNVTGGARAYRFLPAGLKFAIPVEIFLPYDERLNESEAALEALHTYFYDSQERRWESLERIGIDEERGVVHSLSTHFTDMINSTLTLPQGPEPVEFDLNSIKNLEAASPGEGIPELSGLEGGWSGSASFSIPLKLPSGRGGAVPNLAISYDSGRSPSILGLGFSLPISSIDTNTRFGVPEYDKHDFYLLDGGELVLISASDASPQEYRKRQEGDFQRIRRYVSESEDYWEVTEKSGLMRYYGAFEASEEEDEGEEDFGGEGGWLGPGRGESDISEGVYRWHLTRIKDVDGNTVDYRYEYDDEDRNTYISSIDYSGRISADTFEDGKSTITFTYDEPRHVLNSEEARLLGYNTASGEYLSLAGNKRPDKRIDGRGGFPSKTSRRLDKVEISSFGDAVREYDFYYRLNEFGQSVLDSYLEGRDGEEFYRYRFDYFGLGKAGSGDTRGYEGFGGVESSTSRGIWKYGLSGNDSLNFSGNGQIGGYVGSSGIQLGLTGSFGFSAGTSRVLSSVMDINGDGVAELVWRDGSNLRGYNPVNGSNVRLENYGGPISKSSSVGTNLGGRIDIKWDKKMLAFGSFTLHEELE